MDEDVHEWDEDMRECCETYPGTEHDDHCPSPHWPTGDATPERFSLVVNEDRSVTVLDGETPIEHYVGASALADAIQRCMELKHREALGLDLFKVTPVAAPRKFLSETLPAYVRTQRLEAMLAEVRVAESAALAGLTEAITLLNRAVSLRERLEKALETAVRPAEPEREGPWFEVGNRVTFRGWETSPYRRAGLNVVGVVVETKPITGSNPLRQQFRAEGADWCGGGSMWNHSDSYELVPALEDASRPLSATEKPEQAAGVHRGTPYFGRLRGEVGMLHLVTEDSNPGSALSKPQPY